MTDPPEATCLYRREPGTWGVPPQKLTLCDFVRHSIWRDFQLGGAVRAVKWFHEADLFTRDGDAGTFRGPPDLGGFVDRKQPDVVWLNRRLCTLPDASLTRVLVHELMHTEQLARGTRLPVDELEREAKDLTQILCTGLPE